jgi:hypothetical protein
VRLRRCFGAVAPTQLDVVVLVVCFRVFLDDHRLFCGDLGNEVTEEVLAHAFGKYKSFAKAKVVRDKWSRKSKGFGFVSFLDPLDAAAALREMNGPFLVPCVAWRCLAVPRSTHSLAHHPPLS